MPSDAAPLQQDEVQQHRGEQPPEESAPVRRTPPQDQLPGQGRSGRPSGFQTPFAEAMGQQDQQYPQHEGRGQAAGFAPFGTLIPAQLFGQVLEAPPPTASGTPRPQSQPSDQDARMPAMGLAEDVRKKLREEEEQHHKWMQRREGKHRKNLRGEQGQPRLRGVRDDDEEQHQRRKRRREQEEEQYKIKKSNLQEQHSRRMRELQEEQRMENVRYQDAMAMAKIQHQEEIQKLQEYGTRMPVGARPPSPSVSLPSHYSGHLAKRKSLPPIAAPAKLSPSRVDHAYVSNSAHQPHTSLAVRTYLHDQTNPIPPFESPTAALRPPRQPKAPTKPRAMRLAMQPEPEETEEDKKIRELLKVPQAIRLRRDRRYYTAKEIVRRQDKAVERDKEEEKAGNGKRKDFAGKVRGKDGQSGRMYIQKGYGDEVQSRVEQERQLGCEEPEVTQGQTTALATDAPVSRTDHRHPDHAYYQEKNQDAKRQIEAARLAREAKMKEDGGALEQSDEQEGSETLDEAEDWEDDPRHQADAFLEQLLNEPEFQPWDLNRSGDAEQDGRDEQIQGEVREEGEDREEGDAMEKMKRREGEEKKQERGGKRGREDKGMHIPGLRLL